MEVDTKHTHILIVNDDPTLLQAIRLRLPEVHIETTASAFAALDLIREHVYDAIVSASTLPGMNGLAFLAKIQELRSAPPLLLLTERGDLSLAIQALRDGAYDCIQEPIDRDYFVATLHKAIQIHQQRRKVAEQQRVLEAHVHSLEQTIQEQTRELVEAKSARDKFLSLASHELKTPLSSLKGMTQLLHRRLDRAGSPEASYMANMENSIRRIEVLVNDLLSISLVEMGILVLHCTHSDMGVLCRHLVDEYIAGTNPHPVVTVDIPDEPVEVAVDVDRIGQVILNLLSNARKYSPSDAPIRVTLQTSVGECIVSVHDVGVGIAPEVLPHVFERFYRAPGVEVQTGSSVGFGLGLYISQQIVEHHGGRFEIQSIPDAGSIFSVILPLVLPVSSGVELNLASEAQQK